MLTSRRNVLDAYVTLWGHHHQAINVATAGAQAFFMDYT
jgi:hypothetical protein